MNKRLNEINSSHEEYVILQYNQSYADKKLEMMEKKT